MTQTSQTESVSLLDAFVIIWLRRRLAVTVWTLSFLLFMVLAALYPADLIVHAIYNTGMVGKGQPTISAPQLSAEIRAKTDMKRNILPAPTIKNIQPYGSTKSGRLVDFTVLVESKDTSDITAKRLIENEVKLIVELHNEALDRLRAEHEEWKKQQLNLETGIANLDLAIANAKGNIQKKLDLLSEREYLHGALVDVIFNRQEVEGHLAEASKNAPHFVFIGNAQTSTQRPSTIILLILAFFGASFMALLSVAAVEMERAVRRRLAEQNTTTQDV